MPTRKETAKRLISSRSAYNIIARIKFRLNSDKFQELNQKNKAVVEQINKLIEETETTLSSIPLQWVNMEGFDSLDKIEILWLNLARSYRGEVTEEFKDKYNESLQITKDFFNSFSITPTESQQTVSFRNKSTEDEQARLESLSKRRLEVKQLYEKSLKEIPLNEEKIKKLKEQLDALDETYVETKKNLDGIKN